MIRKVLTTLFILILLTTITLGYIYFQKQREYKGADPLNAVPVNAELILQVEDASSLISLLKDPDGMWDKLRQIKSVEEINKKIAHIDSLLINTSKGSSFDLNRPLLLASHLTGKDQIDYLFVIPINDFLEEKHIKTFIQNQFTPNNPIHKREYNGTTLYKINSDVKDKKILNYAFSHGLMLVSQSELLVEDAVRQLSTGNSITQSKGFARIRKTIGKNVDANIFFNLKTFPKQVSFHLDNKYSRYIRNFTHLANWTELDLSLRQNTILLNGFTYSDNQQVNYMNLFLNQEPIKMEIESILPSGTSLLAVMGLQDPLQFMGQYHHYLEKIGEMPQYQKKIREISKSTGIDIEEIIYSILYKEMALVYTEKEHPFTVIRTQSASIAKDKMLKLVNGYARKQQRTLSYYTTHYQLDKATSYTIYKLPTHDFMYSLFGNIFAHAPTTYFTFIGNYMVMGSSVKDLSKFIHESALGKTLSCDKKYIQNDKFLSNKANFYFYTSLTHSLPILTKYANATLKKQFDSEKETLHKFQSLGFQFSSSHNLIYNNIFFQYDPVVETPPQTDWESHLDTCFRHKPYLVRNHYTGKKEILVQDINNKLYLVNSSGRILWKKSLSQSIIGQIYQIDYYKNNKLQYLFATDNKIHLIDRNGNYVANYPVTLKSPAVRGLSLFDYDKNRNYRLFIPCKDKGVYAYTKEGKIIQGWKFNKAENDITSEIQYFRVANKDYIVFADKFRVYILNRKGQERVKLKEQFSKSELNRFYLNKKHAHGPCLTTTDSSGKIYFCHLNGMVEKKQFGIFSPMHRFIPEDINHDGRSEYIFTDRSSLKVISQQGKNLLTKEFNAPISYAPSIYSFSKGSKEIGICLESTDKIFLLNSKGKIHRGFPLKGNTPFTIGLSQKSGQPFQLLVGDDRNFLLNYSVK